MGVLDVRGAQALKRIILGLLFDGQNFYLSRNFRLQRLGNISWLEEHFRIFDLTSLVDEVAVFHVARKLDVSAFSSELKELARNLFVPVSVGGGVRSIEEADVLFRSGADRLLFSSTLWNDPALVSEIVGKYGKQAVIGVLNFSFGNGQHPAIRYRQPGGFVYRSLADLPTSSLASLAGELVLQSVDHDGTGHGFPAQRLAEFQEVRMTPWVAAGGFGSIGHVSAALLDARIEAVLTSNLLAFLGSGLEGARAAALRAGVRLASWDQFSPTDLRK